MIDVKATLNESEERMEMAALFLEEQLARIRAGRANIAILSGVRVESYGQMVPLNQVANVSTPDPRTIAIRPWDKKMIKAIEKAIMDSDVGITPENNGEIVRLGIPQPTEERRRELAKQCNKIGEKAKVEVRNVRSDIKERLKKGHMFTDEYFERQLENIREIRLSERMFYQKVTDLYATAFDYDKDAATTRAFFQTVQNKMHFAVHRHTAAELIVERADAEKAHMGLTSWEAAPDGKIIKSDVTVAKNYLSADEMSYLERIVSLYLDYAELQAERHIPMSMEDWAARLDGFLEFNGNELLTGPGKVSAEEAKLHAETQFERYRVIQDRLFESDFDRFLQLEMNMEKDSE